MYRPVSSIRKAIIIKNGGRVTHILEPYVKLPKRRVAAIRAAVKAVKRK